MRSLPLNWRFLTLTLAVTLGLFGWGLSRLEIDTDILGALPKTNPVVADGTYLLLHHPMQNLVVVDVAVEPVRSRHPGRLRPDGRVPAAGERAFQERRHGGRPGAHAGADRPLRRGRLPVLFSAEQLQADVAPLLEPSAIRGRVAEIHAGLLGLEGIGQQALIARDPLSLGGLVLKRLAPLVPAGDARIARGHLISADNRHLLVVASPAESSTATEFAGRIMERIDAIAAELNRLHGPAGRSATLTAAGAFRAALDNQRIIKRDIGLAVTVSTVGIAALLFFAFCRPAVGLFALLPALGGTMLAYFIFSLFHRSISILVLGFGGAIISFSVDQGIAYLLFLDRPQATSGKAASHEVRSMCLLAVLTTVAAFGTLCFSGFPVFVQLGQFTMLGLGLCFLIVHLVFPRIFPVPAARGRPVAAPPEGRGCARRHGSGRFLGRGAVRRGHDAFREAGLQRQPAGHEHGRRRDDGGGKAAHRRVGRDVRQGLRADRGPVDRGASGPGRRASWPGSRRTCRRECSPRASRRP